MAAHSSILAWDIPQTVEPACSPWGCKESDTTEQLITCVNMHKIGIIVYSSGVIARITRVRM